MRQVFHDVATVGLMLVTSIPACSVVFAGVTFSGFETTSAMMGGIAAGLLAQGCVVAARYATPKASEPKV